MPVIDLRSDTVTRPTPVMCQAMAAAEVGDDVFGDDPTANALQDRIAAMPGKEAALAGLSGVAVVPPDTNTAFVDLAPGIDGAALVRRAAEQGERLTGPYRLRLVTPLDVTTDQTHQAVRVLRGAL